MKIIKSAPQVSIAIDRWGWGKMLGWLGEEDAGAAGEGGGSAREEQTGTEASWSSFSSACLSCMHSLPGVTSIACASKGGVPLRWRRTDHHTFLLKRQFQGFS